MKWKTDKKAVLIKGAKRPVPVVAVYEPWATERLKEEAREDMLADNRRSFLKEQQSSTRQKTRTVNAFDQPLDSVLSNLEKEFDVPFKTHRKHKDKHITLS